jgi:hypothetical protein
MVAFMSGLNIGNRRHSPDTNARQSTHSPRAQLALRTWQRSYPAGATRRLSRLFPLGASELEVTSSSLRLLRQAVSVFFFAELGLLEAALNPMDQGSDGLVREACTPQVVSTWGVPVESADVLLVVSGACGPPERGENQFLHRLPSAVLT